MAARGQKDRLEGADLAFHQRVREGFLAQAKVSPSWLSFDASLSESGQENLVWKAVRPYLPNNI